MNPNLNKYLQDGYPHVEGFGVNPTFYVLNHIEERAQHIPKNILEIGVHHGQFFIGLNQLAQGTAYAVDVFDQQTLNVDESGCGNLAQFKKNLTMYDFRHRGENVKIISGDSLEHSTFDGVERCFYVSVDGGHSTTHVVNDLTVASRIVTHDGVVIVDDFFNLWWPSVTEGIGKYLQTMPTLVPFCSSQNKLWMCHFSHKNTYFDYMKTMTQANQGRGAFYGHNLIYLF